ncbi:pantothenate synthetase [Corynebacterium mustelae]|uniref:pantoate--beta-alanine ligase (AMP-forming) n=2 Tax=Corynebacterium mustelae TaxID=571915 RepID=A0A0G3H0M6_9CORY|nr:pantothenate synthetase [Corynebacterium mustelae]
MIARVFRGKGRPVVLVPLQTHFHAGHAALLRAARRIPGAVTIVAAHPSIDRRMLVDAHIDAVFRYTDETLWPNGKRTTIAVADRGMLPPAHLSADATRILALINAVGCSDVILGENNYELLVTVQHAITDLHFPTTVHSVPTVRMPGGVAVSAKNLDIPASSQEQLLALSAALTAGAHASEHGTGAVLAAVRSVLSAANLTADYIELFAPTLAPAPETGDARLFAAVTINGQQFHDSVGLPLGIGFKNLEA